MIAFLHGGGEDGTVRASHGCDSFVMRGDDNEIGRDFHRLLPSFVAAASLVILPPPAPAPHRTRYMPVVSTAWWGTWQPIIWFNMRSHAGAGAWFVSHGGHTIAVLNGLLLRRPWSELDVVKKGSFEIESQSSILLWDTIACSQDLIYPVFFLLRSFVVVVVLPGMRAVPLCSGRGFRKSSIAE